MVKFKDNWSSDSIKCELISISSLLLKELLPSANLIRTYFVFSSPAKRKMNPTTH